MKIGILESECPTPSEIFIYNLIQGLKTRGHEIHLFGLKNRICKPEFLNWFDEYVDVPMHHPWPVTKDNILREVQYRLHRLKLGKRWDSCLLKTRDTKRFGFWGSSSYLMNLRCEIAKVPDIDIFHAHFAPVAARLEMLKECGFLQAPIVASLHGADVTSDECEEHIASGLHAWSIKHTDLFTYNSSFIKNRACQLGFPDFKMSHVPVPIGSIFEAAPKHPPVRQRGPLRVLSVGRMVAKKGFLTGLEVVRRVIDRGVPVHYTIIGDGLLAPDIRKKICELSLTNDVTPMGVQTQVQIRQEMLTSDVPLFPSETAPNGDMEGQGLLVQEAQACELPVLITRHNGAPRRNAGPANRPDRRGKRCRAPFGSPALSWEKSGDLPTIREKWADFCHEELYERSFGRQVGGCIP